MRRIVRVALVGLLGALGWWATGGLHSAVALPVCDTSWTGTAGDGLWSTAGNWSAGVPASSTNACVTLNGTYTVLVDVASQATKSLTVGAATGVQTLQIGDATHTGSGLVVRGTASELNLLANGRINAANGSLSTEGNGISVIQGAGGVNVTPGTGDFVLGNTDVYKWTGGTNTGSPIRLADAAVNFTGAGSPSGAVSFVNSNTNSRLTGNIPAGVTVNVQGQACVDTGNAYLTGNLTNNGTINLTSIDPLSCGGGASGLLPLAGSNAPAVTLTNAGTINVLQGANGARDIRVSVNNLAAGTFNVSSDSAQFIVGDGSLANAGGLTNAGTVTVAATKLLYFASGYLDTLTLTGGTLTNNGDVVLDNTDRLVWTGGTVANLPVELRNASANFTGATVGAGAPAGGAVYTRSNTNSTLTGNVPSGITLTARAQACIDSAYIHLTGNLTNNGTINLTNIDPLSCGGAESALRSINGGSAPALTLTNAGTINVQQSAGGNRDFLVSVNNQATGVINVNSNSTRFYVGDGSPANAGTLTNAGTITVGAGKLLHLYPGYNDTLTLTGGTLTNNGDVVVDSNNHMIWTGGAVANLPVELRASGLDLTGAGTPSGGVVYTRSSSLDSLTGNIPSGVTINVRGQSCVDEGDIYLTSSLTNNGTINLTSIDPSSCGGAISGIRSANGTAAPALTLTNNGTINALPGAAGNRDFYVSVNNLAGKSFNATAPVRFFIGDGSPGSSGAFTNAGTVNVSATGSISFAAGYHAVVTQTGGTIANLGSFYIDSTNDGFFLNGGTTTGNAVTLANGTLNLNSNGAAIFAVRYSSTLSKSTAGDVTVASGQVIYLEDACSGPSITVTDDLVNNGLVGLRNLNCGYNGTLTIGGTGLLTNNGTVQVDQNTVDGSGGTFTIDGVLDNTATGSVKNFQPNLNINVTDASPNISGGALNGGTWDLEGPISYPGAGTVTTNNATVHYGNGGTIRNSGVDILDATLTANNGSLSLTGNRTVNAPGPFTNAGSVTIAGTADLVGSGSYTQSSGTAPLTWVKAGGTLTANPIVISKGQLKGAGTINGPVTVSGTGSLVPGDSPGTMTINGNLTLGAGGSLDVEVAGTTAGTGYDRVAVTGTVTIDPAAVLNITTTAFEPSLNADFDVVTATGGVTGTFTSPAKVHGWDVGVNGKYFVLQYPGGIVRLHALQRAATLTRNTTTTGEQTTPAGFTVTLSAPVETSGSVTYSTFVPVSGSVHATPGADYTAVSANTVPFGPGELTKPANVTILQDLHDEYDEDLGVSIAGPTSNIVLAGTTDVMTIVDDDLAPVASITKDADPLPEGNAGISVGTYSVTLSAASEKNVLVDWATANGTAVSPGDYNGASGTVAFAQLQTSFPAAIGVLVIGDTLDETNETFNVNLAAHDVTATIAGPPNGSVTSTIADDDATPTLSITGGQSAIELNSGTANMTFPVFLSAPSGQTVTVAYTTSDATATTSDGDYTLTSGTLTFLPGVTSQSIPVPVAGDAKFENDETFTVTLSGPVAATIAAGTSTGTIRNDDAAPSFTIAQTTPAGTAVAEGTGTNPTVTYTVTKTGSTALSSTVSVTLAGATASVPSDVTGTVPTTLTFLPGDVTKTFVVLVNGDALDEADETYTVTLSNPGNATLGGASVATTTITDDDAAPSVSVSPLVGTGEAGSALMPITLSAPSGLTVTVHWATSDETATAGSDYTASSGDVTFLPGQVSQTASIPITTDAMDEPDETFRVTLSAQTNSSLGTNPGQVGILDDDDAPVLSVVAPAPTSEGNAGTSNFTFQVNLSATSGKTVTVHVATNDGTAAQPGDYTTTSADLTFAPGQTTKPFVVPVVGDTTNEANESFTAVLSANVNATVGTGTATATINNDDAAPTVSIANPVGPVTETNSGTTPMAFVVTLSATSGQVITVDYATTGGTATPGSDYSATTGTLTFVPGQTSKNVVVSVTGDTLNEPDETINVHLSNPSIATVAAADGLGTIQNDDSLPTISVGTASVVEGTGGSNPTVNVPVSLSAPSGQAVTVQFTTSSGTATQATDFTAVSQVVTFNPGTQIVNVPVTVIADAVDEADETFTATLTTPTLATIATGSANTTILDDDGPPSLSIIQTTPASTSATEGTGGGSTAVLYTVTLSPTSAQTVTVGYSTVAGTASIPADVANASGTLTFAPGVATQTITANIVKDALNEVNETYSVVLSSPSNAVIGTGTATTTITDDDALPGLSVADANVGEGTGGTHPTLNVPVALSAPSGQVVTVNYNLVAGSATATTDYDSPFGGSLTFNPGETAKTVTLTVNPDAVDENDEVFTVNLSSPGNATLTDASGDVTITDDDNPPTVSISGPTSVAEGNSGTQLVTYTATLNAPSGKTVTVNAATVAGTATAGSDFVTAGSLLTFNPGVTTQTIDVTVNGDTTVEPNETYSLNLSAASNAVVATSTVTTTITNDDNESANARLTGDYDGDGVDDLAVYRPSQGVWYVQQSTAGPVTVGWGGPTDIPVVFDANGDGKDDYVVFRPSNGVWYVKLSGSGTTSNFGWGANGDIPVPGDYDGDGTSDYAVYRPSQGVWYVMRSTLGPLTTGWGAPGDVPLTGDFNGDGRTDIAVYRPSNQTWFVQGGLEQQWGAPGDVPVILDSDGDGKTDVAVFRPSNGVWYVLPSSGGYKEYTFGGTGDVLVPGQFVSGTPAEEIAVYRPSTGTWFIRGQGDFQFGAPGDLAM